LKTDKTPGLDNIHPFILKQFSDVLANPLTYIFNKTLEEGTVPSQWKTASITPIFKKGSKKLPVNYQPVSLTSVMSKVMERIVTGHLLHHLVVNHLASANQHGFTKGHSTVTNLLECLNAWTESLMHKLPIYVVYLDLAKAFDTVPHQGLLLTFSSFGIQSKVLEWIKSFLVDRQQQVRVN
jgi:hypothetical protein